jgi:Fis family transcriptional regulator
MVMDCVEKPLLETVLHHAGGNQTRAAELLGLNRNTLRKKIQQHGI